MLYLLILSIIAPLEPISWSELKARIAEPDTVEVEEIEETTTVRDSVYNTTP